MNAVARSAADSDANSARFIALIATSAFRATVPLTIDISGLESKLNNSVPQRLWAINQHERKCIPAQRVTVCAVHKTKCKGDAYKNVPCKIGFKKTKITPDLASTIVGQVTRGRIRLCGEGDVMMLTMPVVGAVQSWR